MICKQKVKCYESFWADVMGQGFNCWHFINQVQDKYFKILGYWLLKKIGKFTDEYNLRENWIKM